MPARLGGRARPLRAHLALPPAPERARTTESPAWNPGLWLLSSFPFLRKEVNRELVTGKTAQPSPSQCWGWGPPLFSGPLLTGPRGRGACSQTPASAEPELKGKWGDSGVGIHRGSTGTPDTQGCQLEALRLTSCPTAGVGRHSQSDRC